MKKLPKKSTKSKWFNINYYLKRLRQRRDKIISPRGPLEFAHFYLDDAYDLVQAVNDFDLEEAIKQLAFRNFIINAVSALEDFFKQEFIYLVDEFGPDVEKISFLQNAPQKIKDATPKIKNEFTLGQILGESISFQNLKNVHEIFNNLFELEDYALEIQLTYMEEVFPDSDYEFINIKEYLDEIFSLRHQFIHTPKIQTELTFQEITSHKNDFDFITLVIETYILEKFDWLEQKFGVSGKYISDSSEIDKQNE